MLVLSRRIGEQIRVPGCGVTLTVLAVNGRTVRLGVVAPADVAVRRGEAWAGGDEKNSNHLLKGG